MSFGFSGSDILIISKATKRAIDAFSKTKGSAKDYQQLITDLCLMRQVLDGVEKLRVSNQLSKDTLNSLLFAVNSANEAIETFLENYKRYECLAEGASSNKAKKSLRKLMWEFDMKTEVR